MIATIGDDGADLLANADGETVRILMDGSGDVDQSFRRAVARSADGDSIDSYTQLDRAVEKVDDLDGTRQRRAKQLVAETDGAGVKLVDELDDDGLRRVLDLEIDSADRFRTAAARKVDAGHADADDVDKFAKHADNLEGVDGLNSGPFDDFVEAGDPGNVQGALREVRRADEIGSENIRRMSLELKDGKQVKGELDIQLKSGRIIESKSSFGYRRAEVDDQFEKKLTTMRDHPDATFDGNTLEIRASKIGDPDMVEAKITEWETKVAQSSDWNNADITIEVVDESTSTVITG
ncbi:hypothetical protein SAMN05216559_1915 [Halomicrobium zhouii]|uniref:Uncharacterized protein n=1 Tax=Halomicrobium zhouii TaxID=767519 RepID=A0A1I6L2V3_9EURY|nr:hypothetical protein [Halomicrobium zhouii]SFR97794.1 hypothetical protein SAMN05216559_1915 [Halomicrobium zhouii]